MTEEYLIDESVIVYLDRNDYQYHRQLIAFLEDGRRDKKNKKHHFYMPRTSKIKLGSFRWYKSCTYANRFIVSDNNLKPLEKAKHRSNTAKTYVCRYFKIKPIDRIFLWIFPKRLIDLFIYANEQKSKEFQSTKKRKIDANEVVSLDTCKVAILAKRKKLKILSFNEDFKYLQLLAHRRKPYIVYIHPDDLLETYLNHH
jgi:hypothetical protein